MTLGRVTAVVDMQFGSTGKGVVAKALQEKYNYNFAVRVGAPNAGHSLEFAGKVYKMQSIPVSWVDRNCTLVIGAGGLISLKVLQAEIDEIKAVMPNILDRLIVDASAGILDKHHADEEGHDAQGNLKSPIGSTAEGVGAARRARMLRDPSKFRLARNCPELQEMGVKVQEFTAKMLVDGIKAGKSVLLEGTQGMGLSLTHGYWPYVTTGDSSPASMLAESGIPAQYLTDVVGVARTYPIRVANPTLVEGTSGPLRNETSWEELSAKLGRDVQEITTVTKRVRRVGEWDDELFGRSVTLVGPTVVALTFADYLNDKDYGKDTWEELSDDVKNFVAMVEEKFSVRVGMIGTGFNEFTGWTYVNRL